MSQPPKPLRRRFLRAASAAAVAPLVGCGRSSPWRCFTPEEAETVIALTEQIIPADQDPGAREAGVIHYIDRHLAGHFRRFQPTYRRGLAELDRVARERFGRRFAQLNFNEQKTLLEGLTGELKDFFNLVIDHTMQGFYGDPRHGGNRDALSWRMLGVPLVPVRGRQHYEVSGSAAQGGKS